MVARDLGRGTVHYHAPKPTHYVEVVTTDPDGNEVVKQVPVKWDSSSVSPPDHHPKYANEHHPYEED